ncbi:MAG: YqeG family HAD IIIA-type phosphatase [Atopobiaceae bacterium]|nr:YqeG family HAD IIIA-type phosphatase [Atopobiaceae bacterium]
MSLIRATYYVTSLEKVSIVQLKERGIKLVLLDRDNTCIPRDLKVAPPHVVEWFKAAQEAGLTLCFISNNIHLSEVRRSAQELGIEGEGFAMKPLPRALNFAMKRFDVTPEQTVMIGDQIFTDIIAGNLAKVSTILVLPQSDEDLWYTNIIRHVEHRILKNVTFTS